MFSIFAACDRCNLLLSSVQVIDCMVSVLFVHDDVKLLCQYSINLVTSAAFEQLAILQKHAAICQRFVQIFPLFLKVSSNVRGHLYCSYVLLLRPRHLQHLEIQRPLNAMQ